MRPNLLPALLILLALTGCGTATPHPATSTVNVDGNWQIETSSGTITSSGLLLVGALQGSGANITGIFSFADLTQNSTCLTLGQIVTFTGSVDANSNLTLTSAPFNGGSVISIELPLTTTLTSFTTGTIAVTGGACPLGSTQALGAEFPSLTGSFSGTLTLDAPGTGQPTSVTGTAALALTQSSTPNSSGEFPVTGSLNFTSGSCSQTVALSGSASGASVNLESLLTSGGGTLFNGIEAPEGNLQSAILTFVPQLCAGVSSPSSFSGQLTRQ